MTTLAKDFKLLLVEDNIGDFILVSEYLKMVLPDSKLVHAKTLMAALTAMGKNDFDIILLDLSLPDSNGVDSITEIISLAQGRPVIVLTGFTDKQFGIDSLKLGVQDYLIKDEVTPAILLKSISYSIERKKNQQQLEQNEKRYRALIENSTDGLLLVDTDGKVLEMSQRGKKILGLPLNEDLEDAFTDLVHPEDLGAVVNCFLEITSNPGQVKSLELRIKLPSGEYRWIENTFQNLLNEPAVNGIVANYRDITERKNTAVLIQESEEKYRYLFNMNPQSIFIWDPENLKFVDLNETCLQLYGYNKEEFSHMTVMDIRDIKHLDKIQRIAEKMLSKEIEILSALWEHRKKNGELIYMDITSHRIVVNGKIAILAIGSNVTEKILLEQQLDDERIKNQKEITDAVISAQEKERDQIGCELHDNVCQILASSKLYLGMVKKHTNEPEEYIQETDLLISSAIQELRALSHALIPPSMEQAQLKLAIEKVVDITENSTNIQISTDIAEIDETTMSDKMRLAIYRIVQEQFNNILKHAKASKIALKLTQTGGKLLLSIKDNGVGFDTDKVSGGVGLINIKTRASLFNGIVSILSKKGEGCELSVAFG